MSNNEIPVQSRGLIYFMAFEDVPIPAELSQWADLIAGNSGAESDAATSTLSAQGERWGSRQLSDYYLDSMRHLRDRVERLKSIMMQREKKV